MTFRDAARCLGVLAAAWLAFSATPEAASTYSYELTPVIEKGVVQALEVSLRFRGPATGTLQLDLPDESDGVKERWRYVSGFQVTGATVATPSPATRTLSFAPDASVTVRYRVSSAYDADPPGQGGNPYRGAILRPGWFAALGDFIFVLPHDADTQPATFRRGKLPKGWTMESDLDHGEMGQVLTVRDISESTILGGQDVTVVARPILGSVLRLGWRGQWTFGMEDFTAVLAKTISTQREFWGGDLNGPFTVTLLPLTGAGSSGGTGRGDGFALYGTPDTSEATLRRMIAHEHLHSWIPFRIGTMPEGAAEAADYWFSEGFTDFYTGRTLLKSHIWTLEDFTADLNDVLLAYAISPVRNAPNARIVADFWTDQAVESLPYQRGMLLAFLLDRRLRDAGRGNLDGVMFAARDRFVAAAHKPDAVTNFLQSLESALGQAQDLSGIVDRGETVMLPSDLFGACARIETLRIATFDKGFDVEKSAKLGIITGVRTDGPAYAAGLRDGMKRIAREGGKEGDSRVPLGYRIVDEQGRERVITYLPAGHGEQPLQQVSLTPGMNADQRTRCGLSMSGG